MFDNNISICVDMHNLYRYWNIFFLFNNISIKVYIDAALIHSKIKGKKNIFINIYLYGVIKLTWGSPFTDRGRILQLYYLNYG